MEEQIERAKNTAQGPTAHVVLVPEHLVERVEEHVRQLAESEGDTSAFVMEIITGSYQTAVSCVVGGGWDFSTDHYSYSRPSC